MDVLITVEKVSSTNEGIQRRDFSYITNNYSPLEKKHLTFFKRTIDIIFSLLVIFCILSWVFPILYLLSRFISKDSIIFVQKRIGYNNTIFNCFKFRTIKSEENYQNVFNPIMINDSRLTPLGKFLRRTNLDELPQFINVLMGDMSIIGPRPHAIVYENIYNSSIPNNNLRYLIKPGISGWAQIHGLRGDVLDVEENKYRARKRVQYDLWYIKNWSFVLDIKIIFNTIILILKGKPKSS